MAFLIDGHNLIPNIRGISLQDMDDEIALIKLLQKFAYKSRNKVEVYFDKAPTGHARTQKYGMVTVHFVHHQITADQAIVERLRKMGRSARNWTIVTSDRQIMAAVRGNHAQLILSDVFATMMMEKIHSVDEMGNQDVKLGEDEVKEWLRLFEGKKRF